MKFTVSAALFAAAISASEAEQWGNSYDGDSYNNCPEIKDNDHLDTPEY